MIRHMSALASASTLALVTPLPSDGGRNIGLRLTTPLTFAVISTDIAFT